jgi:hypothetical protein
MAIRFYRSLVVLMHLAVVYVSPAITFTTAHSKDLAESKRDLVDTKKQKRTTSGTKSAPKAPLEITNDNLPQATQDMREALLAAATSGQFESLRTPIELNELKPYGGGPEGTDPLTYWRSQSVEPDGRDVLSTLVAVLATTPGATSAGRDLENTTVYVWPGFADADLKTLSTTATAELEALAGAPSAKIMLEEGRYSGWRLAIGADGVWHAFEKIAVKIPVKIPVKLPIVEK